MKAAPVIFLLTYFGLSIVSDWIERRAVRVGEYEVRPPFRFVQWGVVETDVKFRVHLNMPAQREFFAMKLPSWEWREAFWYRRREWCWHRRWLMWERGYGWEIRLMPEAQ